MRWNFGKKDWIDVINLGVFGVYMVFKAFRLDEIIKGVR